MERQSYSLKPNWREETTESLMALRTCLGVQWVLNLKAGYEDICKEIMELKNLVNQELQSRKEKK